MLRKPMRRALSALIVLVFSALAAIGQTVVYTSQTGFEAATGAAPLAFPTSADTALPYKPFGTALQDYSCIQSPPGIDLPWSASTPLVTVQAPAASAGWICFIGPGWNAGPGNTNPTPLSPTIVANGEDDYTLVFSPPVYAVGFELLTNFSATETITLTFADSTTEAITDTSLDTNHNTFEFVGFLPPKPVSQVHIDTTGGASQNEGIVAVKIVVRVDIDIKPCSYPNAVNVSSSGVVPVAILGSAVFDVSQVDPSTVTLQGLAVKTVGKTEKLLCHIEDVVGPGQTCGADGYPDLVCQMQMAQVEPGDAIWRLDARRWDGVPIVGFDSVKVVP